MKKLFIILFTCITALVITGCTNKSSNPNDKNNAGNANQSQNGQNITGSNGTSKDTAYNLSSLIAAVKNAGRISGEPENLSVEENGAEKVIAYGNIVFLEYNPATSNAYFSAYDAGTVKVKGKTVKIGAINGPYMMVFLDEKTDPQAVSAFRSIGYGR